MCALANADAYGGVGVDVEPLDSASRVESVRRLFIDTQEQALVTASPIEDAVLLMAIFSAKESLFKALYPSVGRWFGFQAARVIDASALDEAVDPFTARFALTLELVEDLALHCQSGSHYRLTAAMTDDAIVTAMSVT